MHVILGASGHIGSVLATYLLQQGEQVHVVLHRPRQRSLWQERGAEVSVADVRDTATLRGIFARGRRAFLLNPPADPSGDIDLEERVTLRSLVSALDGSGLERVVAQSTYGARPARGIGDLGVLHELEQALAEQPIAFSVLRGAYYMSNWDFALEQAREQGVLSTFFPLDFALPMVAPHDIALEAAKLMTSDAVSPGVHHVEGPQRYTPTDVARAFGEALGRPVQAQRTPRAEWPAVLQGMGFSERAAASFVGMTEASLGAHVPPATETIRGTTSIAAYLTELVQRPVAAT